MIMTQMREWFLIQFLDQDPMLPNTHLREALKKNEVRRVRKGPLQWATLTLSCVE